MNITFKIDDRRTKAALDAVTKRVKSNVPLMDQLARQMRISTEKNFSAQGRSPRWEGLASSTLAKRRRDKKTGKILQVTGVLAASVRTATSPSVAIIGTNLKYARIHQYGGTINHPGGTAYIPIKSGLMAFIKNNDPRAAKLPRTRPHPIQIPARPFLSIQPDEVKKMAGLVQKFYSIKSVT